MKRKIDENHPLSYFLKSAREDMDLTQLDVMRLTGINNKTLSGYENGVAEPDFKSLATLSKLYNISFDELLCISSENTARYRKTMTGEDIRKGKNSGERDGFSNGTGKLLMFW